MRTCTIVIYTNLLHAMRDVRCMHWKEKKKTWMWKADVWTACTWYHFDGVYFSCGDAFLMGKPKNFMKITLTANILHAFTMCMQSTSDEYYRSFKAAVKNFYEITNVTTNRDKNVLTLISYLRSLNQLENPSIFFSQTFFC